MAVSHIKSNTVADWTGTVTVGNSTGGTNTIAATDLVRPADWNSAHNQFVTISGAATAGTANGSGTNLVYGGSNSMTLNLSTAAGGGQTLWMQPAMSNLTAGANITLSSEGSTISIIGPSPGGGAAPNRSYIEIMNGERMTRPINVSATQFSNRPVFFPFWLDGSGLIPKTVRIFSSWVTNTRFPNFTIGAAIYSLNNSTQLTIEQSTTQAWSVTGSGASASYSGIRAFDITGMTGSMGEGRKILGLYFSAGATANMDASLYGGDAFPAVAGFLSGGTGTAATGNTKHFFPFWGVLASSSAGFPNAVGASDINGGRSADVVDLYAVIKEI